MSWLSGFIIIQAQDASTILLRTYKLDQIHIAAMFTMIRSQAYLKAVAYLTSGCSYSFYKKIQDRACWMSAIESLLQCTLSLNQKACHKCDAYLKAVASKGRRGNALHARRGAGVRRCPKLTVAVRVQTRRCHLLTFSAISGKFCLAPKALPQGTW